MDYGLDWTRLCKLVDIHKITYLSTIKFPKENIQYFIRILYKVVDSQYYKYPIWLFIII